MRIPFQIIDLSVRNLLPQTLNYYHYLGSLTTPPLTENVEWYILTEPVEISQKQIDAFNQYYEDNNRNIQDKGQRKVYLKS